MSRMTRRDLVLPLLMFGCGLCLGIALRPGALYAAPTMRVFEIRTYTAADGKLDALNARFRDHTLALFQKYGMTNIGYFTPEDAPLKGNTLIYILAHPSREAATKSWQAFHDDPEWQKVKADSEAHGPLTTKMVSVFADPTDYSPMK